MIPYGLLARLGGALGIAIILFVFGHSTGSAAKQREWDKETLALAQAHNAALQAARAQEQQWQAKAAEAEQAQLKERQRNEALANDLRAVHASNGRLRNELAAYAAGSADDPAAAIRERATALAGLLEAALRASADCAADGEAVAETARRLLASWPVNPS